MAKGPKFVKKLLGVTADHYFNFDIHAIIYVKV